MQATASSDLATALTLIDPVELPALYDYGPVLVAQVDADGLDGRFTPESIAVVGDGDERRVRIDAYRAEIHDNGSQYTMAWDGNCLSSEDVIDGETIEQDPICRGRRRR